MNSSEIKKIMKMIEYEENCRMLREEFRTHGVRFGDRHGWGFIRNGEKHYESRNS